MDAMMTLFETCCMWHNQFHQKGRKKTFLQRYDYRYQNNASASMMNLFFPR